MNFFFSSTLLTSIQICITLLFACFDEKMKRKKFRDFLRVRESSSGDEMRRRHNEVEGSRL
jgi:hypothetical protein